jgi:hypothetical protein
MLTDRTRVCLLRQDDGSYLQLVTCPCLAVVRVDAEGAHGRCEHCGGEVGPLGPASSRESARILPGPAT